MLTHILGWLKKLSVLELVSTTSIIVVQEQILRRGGVSEAFLELTTQT